MSVTARLHEWAETGLFLMFMGLAALAAVSGPPAMPDDMNPGFLRYVTLPGLRQQILVAFIVTFIAAMRMFDLVFVLTGGGGPGKH